jgi:hypothetical protein
MLVCRRHIRKRGSLWSVPQEGSKYPKPKKVNFKKDLKLLEVEL